MCKLLCTILIALLLISNNAFAIMQVPQAEQVFYYHTDPSGTPLAMTDSSGNVVWRADYKPFGEEQSVTSTVSNDKRFIGKEKDEETGFSYFGARYENAKIGRFIAPDPERVVDPRTSKTNEDMLLNPQRLNTYAYALNNPYRFVDQDGREAIPWSVWLSDAGEAAATGGRVAVQGTLATLGSVVTAVGIVFYPTELGDGTPPIITAPVAKAKTPVHKAKDSSENPVVYPDNPATTPEKFPPKKDGGRRGDDGSVWEKDHSSHGGDQWKRWPSEKDYEKGGKPTSVWPDGRIRK